jgi:transcriptional regulator with XRE-family HTH domain
MMGWSQDHLAKAARVGRQWVLELEKGKKGAPLDLVINLLDALGYALHVSPAGVRIDSELTRSQPEAYPSAKDDGTSQRNDREVTLGLRVSVNSTKGRRERLDSTAEPSPGNYRIATFETIGIAVSPGQLYELENRPSLNLMVAHVIAVEAPMFEDLLARRIARAHRLARATRKLIEITKEITKGRFARTREDGRTIVWPERAEIRELVPFRPAPLDVRDHVDIPLMELAALATPLLAGGHAPEGAAIIMGRQLGLGRLRPKTRVRLIMAAELAKRHPSAPVNARSDSELNV